MLPAAIDEASRLARTKVLLSERRWDRVAFLTRSVAFFARPGVAVERVMTDGGSAHRSFALRDVSRDAELESIRTRPYSPGTNGKAERFIRTSLRVWAHANTPPHRQGGPEPCSRSWPPQHRATSFRPCRPNALAQAEQPGWRRHLEHLVWI
ncbi:hypothetical protein [Acuticoccus sp.]|uniref:hypothetical protein n=1 Tax=Acuticoccus sp. TaxID=1904378 RepID=UPI003B51BB88